VLVIAVPDQFVEHGSVEKLRVLLKIDADSVTEQILSQMEGK
jgi:1-deoxy-D-xylulose-5-phosphate synthase